MAKAKYYQENVQWEANYDEAKVPPYTLPNPLVCLDGTVVKTPDEWMSKRRPELLRLFREYMYGDELPIPDTVTYETLAEDEVFDGLGIRRQIKLTFKTPLNSRSVIMLLYLPKKVRKAPVFVGLTFMGNHVVEEDERIIPTGTEYLQEVVRGKQTERFPLKEILSRGYALATASLHDFHPDCQYGATHCMLDLFYPPEKLQKRLGNYTAIGVWSWGISRMLDCLETIPETDAKKAIVYGHSRLGKTALWTGVRDTRFQLTCVNDSGCGGAALNRRLFGETLFSMVFKNGVDFWFTERLRDFAFHPGNLPFDQHELIALVAPRRVAVHSATLDSWADPESEFLSAYHAGPVFKLFGLNPLRMLRAGLKNDTGYGTDVSYFRRTGGHNILLADFAHYMDCADRIFN